MSCFRKAWWLNALTASWFSGGSVRQRRRSRRLHVEILEDRLTPNAYLVNVAGDSSGSSAGSGGGFAGDLRYCLNQAIADQQADTITFATNAPQTITLSPKLTTAPAGFSNFYGQTAFVIGAADNITIDGTGADVTIDGGGLTRLFVVEGGGTLQLQNLTLTGGSATGGAGGTGGSGTGAYPGAGGAGGGGGGFGGAVLVDDSTFTANGCKFRNNSATGGAGGNAGSGGVVGAGGGGMGGPGSPAVSGSYGGLGGGANGASRTINGIGDPGFNGGFGGGGGGGVNGGFLGSAKTAAGGAGGFGGGGGGGGGQEERSYRTTTAGGYHYHYYQLVGNGGSGGFGGGAGAQGLRSTTAISSRGGPNGPIPEGPSIGGGGGGGAGLGGAIFSTEGTLTLTSDGFIDNTAKGGAGGSGGGQPGQGLGGAVFAVGGTLNVPGYLYSSNRVINGDGSSGDPSAVNIYDLSGSIIPSTAAQPITQSTITIRGPSSFSPAAAFDNVVFNDGAVGTVTSATADTLTVTFTTRPTLAGDLTAIVYISGGPMSGTPVQVATLTPAVTPSTVDVFPDATQITINGFGFDPNATEDTVTFSNGAVGSVVAASPTSLTVQLTTRPSGTGSLMASVTTDGLSSGSSVQVGWLPRHDTYLVNVTGDTGTSAGGVASSDGNLFHGDLRYCLSQAAADAQANIPTIVFDPTVFASAAVDTIALNTTLSTNNAYGPSAFVIGPAAYPISIDGSLGANATGDITVAGAGGTRLFVITGGSSLQLENLTLSGGSATGGAGGASAQGDGGGGAAGLGGAVFVDGSTFTANGCTFVNNQATGGAGGAGTQGPQIGLLYLGGGGGGGLGGPGQDAEGGEGGRGGGLNGGLGHIVGEAGGFGGGGGGGGYLLTGAYRIFPVGGAGGFGGGGGGFGGAGGFGGGGGGGRGIGGFGGGDGGRSAVVSTPAFYGNGGGACGGGGAGLGGAIFSNGGTLTLTNDTFTQNSATGGSSRGGLRGGPGQGDGGAVFVRNGTLTATSDIFSSNAARTAGDVYVLADSGAATANFVSTAMSAFQANAINGAAAPTVTGLTSTPAVNVTANNGTYNGSAYTVSSVNVAGQNNTTLASLTTDSSTLSFTWYVGAGTSGTNLGSSAPKDAGTYTVVVHYASDNASYTNADSAPTTFTISPESLTISAVGDSKTYDGGTNSSKTPTVTAGTVYNNEVTYSQAFQSKDVKGSGGSTLVVSDTVSASGAGDYTIASNTAMGTIRPENLTISATSDSKTYDGGTTSTQTPTVVGTIYNSEVTYSQAFQSKDVKGSGGSTLVVSDTVSASGAGDYTITTNSASGTIIPARLDVYATTDSKVYNGAATSSQMPTFQVTNEPLNTLYSSDTLGGLSQSFTSPNVLGASGSTLQVTGYTINDGNQGNDYSVALHTASGTITKAQPTIGLVAGATVVVGTGMPLTASATLGLPGINETGTIIFTLYSPSNASVLTDVVPADGDVTYTTSTGTATGSALPTVAGTYQWAVSYSGDGNNYGASSAQGSTPEIAVGSGATAVGNSLYLVGGASTTDQLNIQPTGSSDTGSTGILVNGQLNGGSLNNSKYSQTLTTLYIVGFAGNENLQLASTLTIATVIRMGDGNENLQLGAGANAVTLGDGNDNIQAGNGANTIVAGKGNDNLQLGNGNNTVTLGNGNDHVQAGNGNNAVSAGNGNINVQLGAGNSMVTVGNGNDNVQLGSGNNIVVEGNGNDNVQAGNGDNLIVGGLGKHNLQVGNGSNILIDGSVQLDQGVTLALVLDEWIAQGRNAASTIRNSWVVTDNTSNANNLQVGNGLDWFWYTYGSDQTNRKLTDLLN